MLPASTFRPVKHTLQSKVGGKVESTAGASSFAGFAAIAVTEMAVSTLGKVGQCEYARVETEGTSVPPLREEASLSPIGGDMM